MTDENKGNIFLKLVLDTLAFRQYHETYIANEDGADTKTPLDNAVHTALVRQFRGLLFELGIRLEALGYEVVEEFYTDQVLDENGYDLSISGDCFEEFAAVEDLKIAFEEKAGAFLAELPSLLSDLEHSGAE